MALQACVSKRVTSVGLQGSARNLVAGVALAKSAHRLIPKQQRRQVVSRAEGNAASVSKTVDRTLAVAPETQKAAEKYGWRFDDAQPEVDSKGRILQDVPVAAIRRPLGRTRGNDQDKVEALMASIQEIGLQEPIDVLLVDGVYYGFSGCHRYEAHQRLGLEAIKCRVRKATKEVLKMHMM